MVAFIILTCATAQVAEPLDAVLTWNEAALQAIREDKTPPPVAARNLAMVHAAIYDAVNAVSGTHRSYLVNLRAAPGTSAEIAASIAAQRVLIALYPTQVRRFDDLLTRFLDSIPEGESKETGITLGQMTARAVLDRRRLDGSSNKVTLKPRDGPGMWAPTLPKYQPGLLPQWSGVALFALSEPERYRPSSPPRLTESSYTAAYHEVQSLGAVDSKTRTEDQTQIAKFWADGAGTVTPPGHWNRIAQTAAQDRGLTLSQKARLFALLNFALADASIACWDCKYRFNFWRPVHAIREGDTDDNPDTQPDREWKPLLDTPPFPAYTSGHSTFSSAGATVLAEVLGTDRVRFTTTSDDLPGVRRSYLSFWAAAEEAGLSRIYGGIHWRFDNEVGLDVGRNIGRYIARNRLTPRPAVGTSLYFEPRP